jgi:hypothetical protein
MTGRRNQILRSFEGCELGQFLGSRVIVSAREQKLLDESA